MGDLDGWTLVQRGRRHRQDRRPYWNDGGGWMERAPPAPTRGRVFDPRPNPPVPPPRFSRNWGPQSRSYADIVRGSFRRPARRFVSPRVTGSDNIRREPAGPQFRQMTRKLHGVIKIVHHLQNVATNTGRDQPRMISKMVDILTTMIRPASPTQSTMDMIKGNAANWGYTTQLILQEHYETGLETLLEEISRLPTNVWREPFQVAVRWAKRNLTRITQEVIDHAEALITAKLTGDHQPVAEAEASPHRTPRTTITVATMTEGPNPGPGRASQMVGPSREGSRLPPPRELPQDIGPQPPSIGKRMATVATVTEETDQGAEWFQVGPSQEVSSPSRRRDLLSRLKEPLEKRLERGRTGVVFTEDLFLELVEDGERSEDPLIQLEQEEVSEKSALEDLEDLFGSTPSRPLRTDSRSWDLGPTEKTVQAQVYQETEDSQDQLTSPVLPRQRVTRHVNSERKMIDWGLSVRHKWLIIGDSNLSRIPPYDIPDLQIDCYPGAGFRHAEALCKKATNSVAVEKVVLSFGLNHRSQKAKETAVRQLQAALRAAKRKFPFAEIWVPLINFSSTLARGEQQTLMVLNRHIERNMPCLPPLRAQDFATEQDNVHWTKRTGKAMLEHWATLLNFTAL